MDFKKIRKNTARFFSWVGLATGSLIIRCLPASFVYRFARGMGLLAYSFASKHRKLAIESLEVAFGKEKTPVQIKQIAKDCFIFMAKSGVELIFFMNKPFQVKGCVQLEGRDNLDRALAKGCGVILVSAHFGNFPLLLARLAMEGYKAGGIMKPMHDARMEKIFLETRDKFGVKTIYSQPRKACVDNTIQALRNNELIFIPIDQNFGTGGIFVNFFGKKAATAAGPVILSRRTGAALLPCFIVRQPGDRHKIIFEPALDLEEGKDAQDTVLLNIQKLTEVIEKYIRQYPAQWGWIHRRWKSRPN